MARITVDDCLQNVENRFDLILLAAERARQLSSGAMPTVPLDRDKPTMVALRELASGTVRPEALHDSLIRGMQHVLPDDVECDESVPTKLEDQEEFAEYAQNTPRITIDVDAGLSQPRDRHRDDFSQIAGPSDEELAELAKELGFDGVSG